MAKQKFYLSPSTQENNIGVARYNEEKVMNLVADVVQKELPMSYFELYRNNPGMRLAGFINDSNKKVGKGGIHIGIHSNADGGQGTARGCTVYAYKPGTNSDKLAKAVYEEIEAITPSKDRGVKYNPDIREVMKTTATAILIEVAFHTNKDDAAWILSNIEKIGIAIVKGVCKYKGIEYIPTKSSLHLLKTYKVKKGDSYWSIAKKHNMSYIKLMKLNNTINPFLRIGQIIKIG